MQGLHSWKILWTVKQQCAKLWPYGKNGVRGATDVQNVIICKFMTNKYKNICVVYWNFLYSWLKVSIFQLYALCLSIFSRKGSKCHFYTWNFVHWPSYFCSSCLHFSGWNEWFVNTTMVSNHSNAHYLTCQYIHHAFQI